MLSDRWSEGRQSPAKFCKCDTDRHCALLSLNWVWWGTSKSFLTLLWWSRRRVFRGEMNARTADNKRNAFIFFLFFLLWLQNCCNCYMQVYKRKSLLQVFQIVTSFGNEFLWKGNFVLTLLEYRRISDRVLLLLLGGLGLPVLISLLSILIEKKPLNFEQNVILIWMPVC